MAQLLQLPGRRPRCYGRRRRRRRHRRRHRGGGGRYYFKLLLHSIAEKIAAGTTSTASLVSGRRMQSAMTKVNTTFLLGHFFSV